MHIKLVITILYLFTMGYIGHINDSPGLWLMIYALVISYWRGVEANVGGQT